MNVLDAIVQDAITALNGAELNVAVILWTPGNPWEMKSVAVASNVPGERAEVQAALRALLGEVELLIADRREELREQAQLAGIPTPEPHDDDGYQVFVSHGLWKRIGAAMLSTLPVLAAPGNADGQ